MIDGSAYLAVTIGGVQEFIAASRRTADLWAGSRIMSRLCRVAVAAVENAGGSPVIPESSEVGTALPNRVFAVVPAGSVRDVGRAACAAARAEWWKLAGITHQSTGEMDADLDTFPAVRWVGWEPPSRPDGPASTNTGGVNSGRSGLTAGPGEIGGYEWAWSAVSAAMDARKRVRDFPAYTGQAPDICSLCGRRGGHAVLRRLRIADGERLCVVCAVKRHPRVVRDVSGARPGFPSTGSVATAPFRVRVLAELADQGMDSPLADAVREHRAAVRALAVWLEGRSGTDDIDDREIPGVLPAVENALGLVDDPAGEAAGWSRMDGTWCYPDTWQPASLAHERGLGALTDADLDELAGVCRRGRAAVAALTGALAGQGLPAGPARYLAMVLLDGDNMGTALAEPDPGILVAHSSMRAWHGAVSQTLTGLADGMSAVFDGAFGRTVYAGGDDLFGLVPAVCGLPVAARCRHLFGQRLAGVLGRPTASGAVLFFHHSFPLQEALRRAREALAEAKEPAGGKDRLCVVAVRRGGERAGAVVPWIARGASSVDALTGLARWFDGPLSARLLADLHRERRGVAELARDGRRHSSEVARLVNRHLGTGAPADPPAALVLSDLPTAGQLPEPAALIDHLQPARVSQPEQVARWVETLEIARFLAQEGR